MTGTTSGPARTAWPRDGTVILPRGPVTPAGGAEGDASSWFHQHRGQVVFPNENVQAADLYQPPQRREPACEIVRRFRGGGAGTLSLRRRTKVPEQDAKRCHTRR